MRSDFIGLQRRRVGFRGIKKVGDGKPKSQNRASTAWVCEVEAPCFGKHQHKCRPMINSIGVIQGLYRESGKEHGSYYLGFRV